MRLSYPQAVGRERAVPLSNSVSVCDRLRMTFLQKTSECHPAGLLPFRHGLDPLTITCTFINWHLADAFIQNIFYLKG